MNVLEQMEKRAKLVEDMAALDAAARAEDRALTADEKTRWDALKGEFRSLSDSIERGNELDSHKAVVNTSLGTAVGARGSAPAVLKIGRGDTEERALCHYMRTGDAGGLSVVTEERTGYTNADMTTVAATHGAVVVPSPIAQSIVAQRDERALGPRLGVRRIPGKGTTVKQPFDADANNRFTATNQGGTIAKDAPIIESKDLTLVKYTKFIEIAWELLRDEDASLMAFVSDWVARGWATTLNSLLVTEALAQGTAGQTLAGATAIAAGEVPLFAGRLKPEYQNDAQWVLHQMTWAYLQSLTGQQFQFAPTPGARVDEERLLAFPLRLTSEMPQIAAGAKTMLFGNFWYMGYRSGAGLEMLRDPYSAAGTGEVRIYFYFDHVYGVLLPEAIQYATQAAT